MHLPTSREGRDNGKPTSVANIDNSVLVTLRPGFVRHQSPRVLDHSETVSYPKLAQVEVLEAPTKARQKQAYTERLSYGVVLFDMLQMIAEAVHIDTTQVSAMRSVSPGINYIHPCRSIT
jgi:hypothetical protein